MSSLNNRDKVATNIRIRAAATFLFIQGILAWCGSYSSAVTNLTPLLSWHTALDGAIMVSTFVMVSVFSLFAVGIEIIAWMLDGTILFLCFQAVTKCFDIYQSKACFSTIPQDMITIGLLCVVILFDFLQYNDLEELRGYLTLKAAPPVEQQILQRRARLLHIWSLPFAIGILVADIILAADSSSASALATPIYVHIVLDPILAYTSCQNEPPMLHVLGAMLSLVCLASDSLNVYYSFGPSIKMTTYLAYKEWCLYTLLLFDVMVVGVRIFIASYNKKVVNMVNAQANKAKWKVKKFVNPTGGVKKKT
jgi:hypothetical protein